MQQLARLAGTEGDELLAVRFQQIRQLLQRGSPLAHRRCAPAREGGMGGGQGLLHRLLVGPVDFANGETHILRAQHGACLAALEGLAIDDGARQPLLALQLFQAGEEGALDGEDVHVDAAGVFAVAEQVHRLGNAVVGKAGVALEGAQRVLGQ